MNAETSLPFAFQPSASPLPASERAALLVDPGFGRVFTDHMASIRWTEDRGWHEAAIRAREPLTIDPAGAVLHYAQEIFEGLKAYRLADGGTALFRADANARRFRHSARRLAMPELPDGLFLESIRQLVRTDADWIPAGDGGALYLRPFMVASETFLGVRPAREYLYLVIASSVGRYFKGGPRAVSLWVSDGDSRAGPGGTGSAKCGGNYAASLRVQAEAMRRGYDQVVFLDAATRTHVEELGGMNVFFVFADGRLRTPPLSDTILAGITRDSLLVLARDMGLEVEEAPYAVDDWRAEAEAGRIAESFACGTAAVVTPIGTVSARDFSFTIGDGQPGPVTTRLHDALVAIQRGTAPDRHGWLERLA
jgi:branched-chain amino acid aminotransferase